VEDTTRPRKVGAPDSVRRATTAALDQVRSRSGAVASAPPEREFHFTDSDFEKVRGLIYDHAGISLAPIKRDMVYSRLARRLRACGDKTFAEYLRRLEHDSAEWETFTNSLTTNLTSFFREEHHFDILTERLKQMRERRTVKIWCSAASTGEEPYSIAIAACEGFNSLTPPVEIVASDIDTNVLAHAQAGVFRADRIERMSESRKQRFFLRGKGAQEGFVRVRPELQKLVEFKRINLLDSSYPLQGPFDYLFCRNVMIYFDKDTQRKILTRFVPLLRKDGVMFAGHSESFLHCADLFRSRGRTVYERSDANQ